jgi:hypothetical protein
VSWLRRRPRTKALVAWKFGLEDIAVELPWRCWGVSEFVMNILRVPLRVLARVPVRILARLLAKMPHPQIRIPLAQFQSNK